MGNTNTLTNALPVIPTTARGGTMSIRLMEKSRLRGDRTAIVAPEGMFSYRRLLDAHR
ncbi:MAG TPA: hypothetical protein PK114_08125 [Smithellaceae bacterium]|nr:hypothetical protein [Smithellaceae bacterium]